MLIHRTSPIYLGLKSHESECQNVLGSLQVFKKSMDEVIDIVSADIATWLQIRGRLASEQPKEGVAKHIKQRWDDLENYYLAYENIVSVFEVLRSRSG